MSSFSNADTGSKPADPYTAKNLQEPSLKEKVEDLQSFVDKSKFCMMTTKTQDGLLASRCMAVAARVSYTAPHNPPILTNTPTQEDNGIDFIFHTNTESGKTDDLQENSDINLAFLNNSGEWASISGTASIETDRARVEKYYSPSLKAWLGDLGDGKHDGGPQDPRIGLIKVTSKTAQYATSRRTAIGGAVEFAKGVVTGETAQVNKLRHIEAKEVEQCKFICDRKMWIYRTVY
jgi:general stress protein 26